MLALLLYIIAFGVFLVTSTSVKQAPVVAKAFYFARDIFGDPFPGMKDLAPDNEFIVDPAAYVGIVKSAEAYAEDIEYDEIESMVNEVIALAGGLGGIISDGDTVILKPNIVSVIDATATPTQLQAEVNGATTDYRVMQALVNHVRLLNPTGKIFIMEGSGAYSTRDNMLSLNYNLITGADSVFYLEEVCGAWEDTTSVLLQAISLAPDKVLYDGDNGRYWLNKIYYNADVVISVPVLKNHFCTGATGGIKNVGIGATPATIYANEPYIIRMKIDHSYPPATNLHYFIHDYYFCRPVDFVFVDGLQGLENGPLSVNTTSHISEDQKNMRLMLAGSDPLAVDAISALLVSQDPELVPHLVTLHNDLFGCNDARLIRVKGPKVGDEKKDFETHDTGLLSKYDDFDAPVFSVNECYVNNDVLYFSLTVDEEVTKVEVSVDGVYLDQVAIGSFEAFNLELGNTQIHQGSEILVYAYDKYLNYGVEEIMATSIINSEQNIGSISNFKIYPNPSNGLLRIHFSAAETADVKLSVCSAENKMVKTIDRRACMAGNNEIEVDLTDLPSGMYFLMLDAPGFHDVEKLIIY